MLDDIKKDLEQEKEDVNPLEGQMENPENPPSDDQETTDTETTNTEQNDSTSSEQPEKKEESADKKEDDASKDNTSEDKTSKDDTSEEKKPSTESFDVSESLPIRLLKNGFESISLGIYHLTNLLGRSQKHYPDFQRKCEILLTELDTLQGIDLSSVKDDDALQNPTFEKIIATLKINESFDPLLATKKFMQLREETLTHVISDLRHQLYIIDEHIHSTVAGITKVSNKDHSTIAIHGFNESSLSNYTPHHEGMLLYVLDTIFPGDVRLLYEFPEEEIKANTPFIMSYFALTGNETTRPTYEPSSIDELRNCLLKIKDLSAISIKQNNRLSTSIKDYRKTESDLKDLIKKISTGKKINITREEIDVLLSHLDVANRLYVYLYRCCDNYILNKTDSLLNYITYLVKVYKKLSQTNYGN